MAEMTLEGYLEKTGAKGPGKDKFRKRWFSIKKGETELSYFSTKESKKPAGSIELHTITQVVFSKEDPTQITKRKSFFGKATAPEGILFEIQTDSRVFHLKASNEIEAAYWIHGLTDIVNALKNPPPPSPSSVSRIIAPSVIVSEIPIEPSPERESSALSDSWDPSSSSSPSKHLSSSLSDSLEASDDFQHHSTEYHGLGNSGTREDEDKEHLSQSSSDPLPSAPLSGEAPVATLFQDFRETIVSPPAVVQSAFKFEIVEDYDAEVAETRSPSLSRQSSSSSSSSSPAPSAFAAPSPSPLVVVQEPIELPDALSEEKQHQEETVHLDQLPSPAVLSSSQPEEEEEEEEEEEAKTHHHHDEEHQHHLEEPKQETITKPSKTAEERREEGPMSPAAREPASPMAREMASPVSSFARVTPLGLSSESGDDSDFSTRNVFSSAPTSPTSVKRATAMSAMAVENSRRVTTLEHQLRDVNAELKRQEERASRLQFDKETLLHQVQGLQSAESNTKFQVEDLQRQNKLLELKFDEKNRQVERLSRELELSNQTLTKMRNNFEEKNRAHDHQSSSNSTAAAASSAISSELNSQIDRLQAQLQSVLQQSAEKDQRISSLEEKTQQLQTDLEASQASLRSPDVEKPSIEESNVAHELKVRINQLELKVEMLSDEIVERDNQIAFVNEEIAAKTAAFEELQTQYEELKLQTESSHALPGGETTRVSGEMKLLKELKQSRIEIAKRDQEIEQLRQRISQLESEMIDMSLDKLTTSFSDIAFGGSSSSSSSSSSVHSMSNGKSDSHHVQFSPTNSSSSLSSYDVGQLLQEIQQRDEQTSSLQTQLNESLTQLALAEASSSVSVSRIFELQSELHAKDSHIRLLSDQLKALNVSQAPKRPAPGADPKQNPALAQAKRELEKTRMAMIAHQTQNSHLAHEIERLEKQLSAVKELKDERMKIVNDQLSETRSQFLSFRSKVMAQGNAIDSVMQEELRDLQEDYFFALAVGIKLNLAMQGTPCNMDVRELYEVASKEVPFRQWRDWLVEKLGDQAAPLADLSLQMTPLNPHSRRRLAHSQSATNVHSRSPVASSSSSSSSSSANSSPAPQRSARSTSTSNLSTSSGPSSPSRKSGQPQPRN